ncbi:MAG: glycosyltransferase 87 family protein [Sandaracinaceae bacterium]
MKRPRSAAVRLSMEAERKARWGAALIGVGCLTVLAFALQAAPREAVPLWLGSLVLSGASLAAGAWLYRARLDRRAILGVALALRLAALAAPVSLSDDVHRYAWDGTLLVHGQDPYASRPEEVVGQFGLEQADLSQLNSPAYYSVYPPLAQAVFGLGGLARALSLDGTWVLRALLVTAEMFGVWALLLLLRRLDRPQGWALLYAWHPLVAWEVAGGGHTEALMLPLLLFGLVFALDGRGARAGAMLGLAVAAKLTAALAGPILCVALLSARGWREAARFVGAAAVVFGLSVMPFASAHLVPHVSESLRLYSETFSFNAPLYYGARWMLGYREGITPPVDAALVPWLTGLTCVFVGLFAAAGRSRGGLVAGLAWTFAAHLLLSRVMHPWYLLPVIALAAASGRPALLVLGSLTALSYLRYDPLGHEAPWVLAAQAIPLVMLALVELAGLAPSTVETRRDKSHLPRGAKPS